MVVKSGSESGAQFHGWPPAAPRLWARAFGCRLEDLDVDFKAPRPYGITQLLAGCIRDAQNRMYSGVDLWQWTVARRTQALLAVAGACGIPAVTAVARCPRAACGEPIELECALESLARATETSRCTWRSGDKEVTLRLPTGDDQRRWLASPPADPSLLPLWMGTSLVREVDGGALDAAWQLPASWLPGIESALAEQDPLTDLSTAAACPGCDHEFTVEIDLDALLLGALARIQQGLLFDIHRLAGGYHWSERQILALPAWRRAYYLAALHAEA